MSHILITGGLGFIGSHVAVTLLNKGYSIIIIDNLYNSKENVLEKIIKITHKNNIIFYKRDLCDDIDDIFTNHTIDGVIHMAGLKSVKESIDKPLLYYKINILSTINLVETMIKHNCYTLIFSSSATVYGSAKAPLKEISETGKGISNPYGRTKYIIEKILLDVCDANKLFKIVSLRYFNPIGAHPSGLLVEDPNGKPYNLMPHILKVAYKNNIMPSLKGYDSLSIYGNNYNTKDGTAVRDYIHVMDVAKAHYLSLNKIANFTNYNYFNIGTGKGTSVLDVVHTFKKVNNIVLPYIIKEGRPGDLEIVYCDTVKSLEILEFKPDYNLEDMCRHAWNKFTI